MVLFSKQNLVDITVNQALIKGYKCQNWGTTIECYKRPDGMILYYHKDKNLMYAAFKENKKIFKVIVAGSRTFADYLLLKKKLDFMLQNKLEEGYEIEIVCGGARGADSLGERYAKEKGYAIKYFIPDWEGEGKAAGYHRNELMAQYADACLCFWDGISRGTMHMINLAKKYKLKLLVTHFIKTKPLN